LERVQCSLLDTTTEGILRLSTYFESDNNFNRTTSAVSQSLCKTERLVTNEFESSTNSNLKVIIKGVERDDLTYKSIDRDINIEVVMNKYEDKPKTAIHNKRKSQKEGDLSLDNYDHFHNSKLIASINESQELHTKMLETSLNSSITAKAGIPVRSIERSILSFIQY